MYLYKFDRKLRVIFFEEYFKSVVYKKIIKFLRGKWIKVISIFCLIKM